MSEQFEHGDFVVVTTDKDRRGVFAGVLEGRDEDLVTLSEARMAVYWSKDVRGVVGLAATGPTEGCRITKAAPFVEINGVTSIMECSDEAAEAWREEPWS